MAGLFRRPEGPPQLREDGTVDSNIKWERRPQDPAATKPDTERTSSQPTLAADAPPAPAAEDQKVLVEGDPADIVLESEVIEALDDEDLDDDETPLDSNVVEKRGAEVHLI